MSFCDKDILQDHYLKIYKDYRNKEILRYANIKLIIGVLVIFYFAMLDVFLQNNLTSFVLRSMPIISIVVFLSMKYTVFKKDLQYVNLFYNAFLVALMLMMYGKMYINIETEYFTSSQIGTIMVLCIVGIEVRAQLRTVILLYFFPILLFILVLLYTGKLFQISILDYSHILGVIIIGSTVNNVQENLRYKGFLDKTKLEVEKNKTDVLYQSVVEQKEEIEAQKEEIESQRDVAESQRDKIISQKNEITSSIHYAKRIQMAMLPQESMFHTSFDQSFILYKPKDIVSGDFYWINKVNDWVVFALADCTGHGVPGAFMSMLGITILNELTAQRKIHDVDVILNELRSIIITSLRQKEGFGETKDGMDMSICAYNPKTGMLHFAGANNSLMLIRQVCGEAERIEVRGDKMPISIYQRQDPFTKHSFRVMPGDKMYLFSDGYPDQFGGKRNKKLKLKPFKELLFNNSKYDMNVQKDILESHIYYWMNHKENDKEYISEQNDDISVLGIMF